MNHMPSSTAYATIGMRHMVARAVHKPIAVAPAAIMIG